MKSLLQLFAVIIIITTTTTSCVSNYIVSTTNHKYPTTDELLAYHPKSDRESNSTFANKKKIASKNNRFKNDIASTEINNIYAEKGFSSGAYNLISVARTYLGTPYKYGGTTRNGIDCSSFVQHVFRAFDISLPRTSVQQSHKGSYVSKNELKKGDLIFFAHSSKSGISHVGIVESVSPTGEIFFIHASSSKGVTISSLDTAYWRARFRSGKRILNLDEDDQKLQEENQNENSLAKISFLK